LLATHGRFGRVAKITLRLPTDRRIARHQPADYLARTLNRRLTWPVNRALSHSPYAIIK